jgi:hypothetical protein
MFAIVGIMLLVSRAEAQKTKPATTEPVTIEKLVTAQPVPEGYTTSRNELKDGEKLLGRRLVFSKEGAVSKVMVSVENRKLPDKDHKVTALKGYINGTAKSLAAAGLELVKKDIPDIAKVNVDKRTKCSLAYKNAEGGDFFVQMQILFTDVGYNIMVVADNEEDYKALAKWAETIEPIKEEKDSKK